MVDDLATYYGTQAVFLELDDQASYLGYRLVLWQYGCEQVSCGALNPPRLMVDSGHQVAWGYTSYADSYSRFQSMVDASLARPAQADLHATSSRVGNTMYWTIQLTNLTTATLGTGNYAEVVAITYEEREPAGTQMTHRVVRDVAEFDITPNLAPSATMTITMDSGALTNVVDWNNVRSVVLVDYRPAGSTYGFDMLQAAVPQAEEAPQHKAYLPLVCR